MKLTYTLAVKGYCLALISEMDDETLDEAMAKLEEIIKQRKQAAFRVTPADVEAVGDTQAVLSSKEKSE